jgi:hypothetical protein
MTFAWRRGMIMPSCSFSSKAASPLKSPRARRDSSERSSQTPRRQGIHSAISGWMLEMESDCGNPSAARVTVENQEIVVKETGKMKTL